MSNMTPEQQEIEKEWRDSFKPAWGPGETLLYAIPGKVGNSSNKSIHKDPILQNQKGTIVSEGRDIRFAKFAQTPNVSALCSTIQHTLTDQTLSLVQLLSHNNNLVLNSPLTTEYQWRNPDKLRSGTLRHSSNHLRNTSNLFGSSRLSFSMTKTPKPMVCPHLIKPPTNIASAKTVLFISGSDSVRRQQ